jgi:predicted nucleic acid-binding protein
MAAYVLDASALMAFFEDRTGAEKVEGLLFKAAETKRPLLMSVINWGEVYYATWRAHGESVAFAKLRQTALLPVELIEASAELALAAATLKAQHGLPYADCFAAALAETRKATLITSDKDFESVASVVRILWIGDPPVS